MTILYPQFYFELTRQTRAFWPANHVYERVRSIPKEEMNSHQKSLFLASCQLAAVKEKHPELLYAFQSLGNTIQFYSYESLFPENYRGDIANYWYDASEVSKRPGLEKLRSGCISINTDSELPYATNLFLTAEVEDFLGRNGGEKLHAFRMFAVHELSHFADEVINLSGNTSNSGSLLYTHMAKIDKALSGKKSIGALLRQAATANLNYNHSEAIIQREVFAGIGESYFYGADRNVSPILFLFFEKIIDLQLRILCADADREFKQNRLQIIADALYDSHLIDSIVTKTDVDFFKYVSNWESEGIWGREQLKEMYIMAEEIYTRVIDMMLIVIKDRIRQSEKGSLGFQSTAAQSVAYAS